LALQKYLADYVTAANAEIKHRYLVLSAANAKT